MMIQVCWILRGAFFASSITEGEQIVIVPSGCTNSKTVFLAPEMFAQMLREELASFGIRVEEVAS